MRITLTADTHRNENLVEIKKSDMLIHAGDFDLRREEDFQILDDWFGGQPAKHKLFIGGNHDFLLEEKGYKHVSKVMKNAIYLEDCAIEIEGIKFYGLPWTPTFGRWAFMADIEKMHEKVEQIPDDVDVLISHGPPFGILDQLQHANGTPGMSVGSVTLRDAIKKRIKPRIVVCGHIHEGYGTYYDGQTNFFNVAFMDDIYYPSNPAMIIELKKKKGILDLKVISSIPY